MATLNVQDYGATGDGSTDDTAAIQSAVDDANSGDTIYFPEASVAYSVTTSFRACVKLDNIADNCTILGEGPNSKLRLDSTGSFYYPMGTDDNSTASFTSITVQKMTFDGHKSLGTDGAAFDWGSDADVTGKDILMEDCIFENSPRSGCAVGGQGLSIITWRRCTSRNNDLHGINPIGTHEGTASNPESRIYDLKATDNGGLGVDFHTGNHLMDGYYGHNNKNGVKGGARFGFINHVTMRNCNLRESQNMGFYTSITDDTNYSITFDNVQIYGSQDWGLRIEDNSDWTFDGPVLVEDCGRTGDPYRNIFITNDASLDATVDTVYSQHGNFGAGVYNFSDDTSIIDTLQWFNNPDGAYNDEKGTLTVNNTINAEASALDVPGSNDVGAYSSTASTVGSRLSTTSGVIQTSNGVRSSR